MELLGEQGGETHEISYNFVKNHGLLRPVRKTINRAHFPHYYSFRNSRTFSSTSRVCSEELSTGITSPFTRKVFSQQGNFSLGFMFRFL
jgi:hypothetical protein